MWFARTVLAVFLVLASASAPALATVGEHGNHATQVSMTVDVQQQVDAEPDRALDCCDVEDTRLISCGADLLAIETDASFDVMSVGQNAAVALSPCSGGLEPAALLEPPRRA